jgi:hypothetical protein
MIKRIVIEALRATKRPELEEIAQWIADAEDAAIKTIAKFIAESFKTKGQISEETAKRIVEFKNNLASRKSGASENEKPPTSFLEQYLELLNYIAVVGSWGPSLLLKGFIHSADCASLWRFDRKKTSELIIVSLMADHPYILVGNSAVQISLFPKVSDTELLALNEELGEHPDRLPKSLSIENGQTVIEVQDGQIEVEVTRKETKTTKRGTREVVRTDREKREIDKTFGGVAALVESLPIAIEARGKAFARLSKIIQSGGKTD